MVLVKGKGKASRTAFGGCTSSDPEADRDPGETKAVLEFLLISRALSLDPGKRRRCSK